MLDNSGQTSGNGTLVQIKWEMQASYGVMTIGVTHGLDTARTTTNFHSQAESYVIASNEPLPPSCLFVSSKKTATMELWSPDWYAD